MTVAPSLSEPDVRAWAHLYADLGLRVLPIKPGEKRPPMPAWQEAATTEPATIDSWWTQLYRGHGVGIATGRGSGVFVLDVDVADGKAGDDTLAELVALHGPLPDTWTVITGSGGAHYYFAMPQGVEIRNDAGRRLGPGLDIRGEGGQVVAPPTVGRLQPYAWEIGPGEPLAEAPAWLVELLVDRPAEPVPVPVAVSDDDSIARLYNERTTWHQLLTADNWTLVRTMSDGEAQWTRPGKDPRDGISATTGHEGRDCLTVFTSSIPNLPEGTYSKFGYTAAMHRGGDRKGFARELRKAEPSTPIPSLTAWQPSVAHDPTTRLELAHLVDWRRFWDDDHSDEEWLAYPIVPAGRAIALYAPAKAGKSTVTLAIAAAVATGRPVLGRRLHPVVDVLYLDYEMTQADLQQRLIELGYGPDDDLEHLHYALLPSLPPLDTVEGATAVLELIEQTGATFVVVDTFGRAVAGEEDHADTVRDFYRHTGLSLKARGVTYLRTDHSGKDVSKGMRGSSAKNDDVDLVWQLLRTETGKDSDEGGKKHTITLTRTHSRISWVPQEVKVLRKPTDQGGYNYEIEGHIGLVPLNVLEAMQALVDAGWTPAWSQNDCEAIKDQLGTTQALTRQAHKRLIADHQEGLKRITPTVAEVRGGGHAPETPSAWQNGHALGSESHALHTPKGNKGAQSHALDPIGHAPETEYRVERACPKGHAPTHQPDETDDFTPF